MRNNKAIFLDRDGVLNKAIIKNGLPYPPSIFDEFEIIPQIIPILDDLKKRGFLIIVITNQPDVKRGKTSKEFVEKINQKLLDVLPIDKIISCFHDDEDNCGCRKPKPGAILFAADMFSIDLNKSFMVGDRWRDIEAGNRAGCKTIFVDYGYREKSPIGATFTIKCVAEIDGIILGKL